MRWIRFDDAAGPRVAVLDDHDVAHPAAPGVRLLDLVAAGTPREKMNQCG